jgi:hypothetical protein
MCDAIVVGARDAPVRRRRCCPRSMAGGCTRGGCYFETLGGTCAFQTLSSGESGWLISETAA